MKVGFRSLAAAVLLSTAGVAHAATVLDYNIFVSDSYRGENSDVAGRIAAGGDVRLANFSVGSGLAGAGGDTLSVGGTLTFNNGRVVYGDAVAGALKINKNVGFANGSARTGVAAIDFGVEAARLSEISTTLAKRDATGKTDYRYGGLTFTGSDAALNIFTLTNAQLSQTHSFAINVPKGSVALFNVSGSSITMQNFGFALNGVDAAHILFNFHEADSVKLTSIGLQGTILAPLAAVTFNNGRADGQLFARSLAGNGQFADIRFAGDLFATGPGVPEPSTWAMMIAGFGLVGAASRRRRAVRPVLA